MQIGRHDTEGYGSIVVDIDAGVIGLGFDGVTLTGYGNPPRYSKLLTKADSKAIRALLKQAEKAIGNDGDILA